MYHSHEKQNYKDSQIVSSSKNDFNNTFALEDEPSLLDKDSNPLFPNGFRIVGNIFNQYIILEDSAEKSVYLLDQHAAHERINYEKFKKNYEATNISSQALVSGYLIELSPREFEVMNSIRDMMEGLGFEIDDFGENTFILRSVPVYLEKFDPEKLFRGILESSEIKKNLYDINPYHVMKLACSASIKTGEWLSNFEINKLIEKLGACNMPFTCPHGRPTLIKIEKKEIDKEFFRIQT